ncbi:hypothetical protein HYU14_07535 [Candidatus Woesearchaeota archaeon]|nr:hypothetical protein [Candidatus Woesearchaeota archaeon]
MANITQKVHNFIQKNPALMRFMINGLINVKALAMEIEKSENIKGSLHGIMSAIRRYPLEEKAQHFGDVEKILANSKISTKSRLVYITLKRDFSFLAKALPQLLAHINPSIGEVLRISEGRESFKFLIDQAKTEEILSLLKKEYIMDVRESLAEINIHLAPGYEGIFGIRSAILNELSSHNVSVIETIGCLPEFMLIVNEKDIGKAHDVLLSLFYK